MFADFGEFGQYISWPNPEGGKQGIDLGETAWMPETIAAYLDLAKNAGASQDVIDILTVATQDATLRVVESQQAIDGAVTASTAEIYQAIVEGSDIPPPPTGIIQPLVSASDLTPIENVTTVPIPEPIIPAVTITPETVRQVSDPTYEIMQQYITSLGGPQGMADFIAVHPNVIPPDLASLFKATYIDTGLVTTKHPVDIIGVTPYPLPETIGGPGSTTPIEIHGYIIASGYLPVNWDTMTAGEQIAWLSNSPNASLISTMIPPPGATVVPQPPVLQAGLLPDLGSIFGIPIIYLIGGGVIAGFLFKGKGIKGKKRSKKRKR